MIAAVATLLLFTASFINFVARFDGVARPFTHELQMIICKELSFLLSKLFSRVCGLFPHSSSVDYTNTYIC